MKHGRATIHNILAVARREFVTRTRTRSFVLSTAFLVAASVLVAMAPVVIGYLDRNSTTSVGVAVEATDLQGDPVATIDALLNATSDRATGGETTPTRAQKAFVVERVSDVDGSRRQVQDGKLGALVAIERSATGELDFTIYTNEPASGRTPELIRQTALAIAIQDRLARAGLTAVEQATLFDPPTATIQPADPAKPATTTNGMTQEITSFAVVFGLVMFLFLAIILYGTWVAMSVVEEKSSRMMEIILSAATPFELLSGKVLGVGSAALVQFGAVMGAAIVALLLEGRIASIVLGDTPEGLNLPVGLTPGILVVFTVFFILGFILYAVLFAAAGALVSRQEDVNQVITPMTMVATIGYLIALYASIGIIDPNAPWVIVLSWVPFLSPYMILARLNAGTAGPPEVLLDIVLLLLAIVAMAWIAARIYRAGVLSYGQRPSLRGLFRAVRAGR